MADAEKKQVRPFWLMLCLSVIIIIFGIITICAPSLFWKFMDIILGIFLILTGTCAIINSFKNRNTQFIRLLLIFGILILILGFILIFSRSQFIGTMMIRIFAIWAFLRGIILMAFSILNRKDQPFWWAILGLGILLFILGIVIMVSPKDEARTLAGICIGISTLLDGVVLLFFSLMVKDNPSLQSELVNQANQNEIAQGDVAVNTPAPEVQQPAPEVQQPAPEVQQPAPEVQQPTPEVQQPAPEVQQPTPEVQQPTPEVQQPAPEVQQSAPEVQQDNEQKN